METVSLCPRVPTHFCRVTKLSSNQSRYCMLPSSVLRLNYSPLCHSATNLTSHVIRAQTSHIQPEEPRRESVKQYSCRKDLGILDFLKGKNFFVTGATGFLAKVVIEKILRTQPEVGKLFLVIKAKDGEHAMDRLKNEIIYSELFRCLQDVYGSEYEDFMLRKMVAVVGDVSVDKLGMKADMVDELAQQVDIILNSAANTSFDERYDVSLETNTKGPSRLMEFGKCCKRLQLFIQISTAYVNGQRKGKVEEKQFRMGDSIAKEIKAEEAPPLDIFEEFDLSKRDLNEMMKSKGLHPHKITKRMKDVALDRARRNGWQDVYVFSKAMGEMLLDYNRGQIPVVIVRPSVIESTYSDPFPGWIEGLRMLDPFITYYGKGQLTAFVGNPNVPLDIVPVDMVANAILAAMTKHAGKPGLEVFQVASSVANPVTLKEISNLLFEHFKSHPHVDAQGKTIQVKEPIKFFSSIDDFSSSTFNPPSKAKMENGSSSVKLESLRERIVLKLMQQLVNTYKPYTCYEGRFVNSNTERLFQELSEEEKKLFGFDVNRINWKDYIENVHIPGLRRRVMKDRGANFINRE